MQLWAFLLVGFFLNGCYVVQQAYHQNNLFNSRKLISDVIADSAAEDKTKEKLKDVQAVLLFASEQGLNVKSAYRYYIETKNDSVSYIVQAAFKDQLKYKTWWFPIVGSVPYIGFFDREERDQEAARLKEQDYDVEANSVGAFSSLGWFEDPIYSTMLRRSDYDLSHLLLHELVHRTIWVRGSAEFNENLAEFIADALNRDYLKLKNRLEELRLFELELEDKSLYSEWLKKLKQDLQELYSLKTGETRDVLFQRKADIFSDYTGPKKPKFKKFDFVSRKEWNNATVLGASLYASDQALFSQAKNCVNGTMRDFISTLEIKLEEADDPLQALQKLCGK